MDLSGLPWVSGSPALRRMIDFTEDTAALPGRDLVTVAADMPTHAGDPPLSAAGQATLCAYKADWTHYAA